MFVIWAQASYFVSLSCLHRQLKVRRLYGIQRMYVLEDLLVRGEMEGLRAHNPDKYIIRYKRSKWLS